MYRERSNPGKTVTHTPVSEISLVHENSANQELLTQIEASRLATETLVAYALGNGAHPGSFSHLPQVWDQHGYHISPVEDLPGMPGITLTETGESLIREDHVEFTTVFHESVHRAGQLRRIQTGGLKTEEVIAAIYGFTISGDNESLIPLDEKILRNIPIANHTRYLEAMKKAVKPTSDIFNEGLTSWIVDRADGMVNARGERITIPPDFNKYLFQTEILKAIRSLLDSDTRRADAVLIQAALSGNIHLITTILEGQISIPILMQNFIPIIAISKAGAKTSKKTPETT